jgi:integrase
MITRCWVVMMARRKPARTHAGRVNLFTRETSRGNVWYLDYYGADGKRRTRSTRTTDRERAVEIARQIDRELEAEQFGTAARVDRRARIDRLLPQYLAKRARRYVDRRQIADIRRCVMRAAEHIGAERIGQLTVDGIESYIDSLLDAGLAPRTANRHATHVKAFVHSYLPSALADVRRRPEHRKHRERLVYTPDEIGLLLDSARRPERDGAPGARRWEYGVYLVAYYQAMRLREVRNLRWDRVDMAARTITLRPVDQKNKRHSMIPLAPEVHGWLLSISDGQTVRPNDYVISTAASSAAQVVPESVGKHLKLTARCAGLRVIVSRAGLCDLTLDVHSLRHARLTHLGHTAGVTLEMLHRFARHATIDQTLVYLREDRTAQAEMLGWANA